MDWAQEFHEGNEDKPGGWKAFEKSGNNIYNAATPHEFLEIWEMQCQPDSKFPLVLCLLPCAVNS